MKGTPAIYHGRIVDKNHFRTNIYDCTGKKRLVESWDEFESAMQSGIWFSTRKDALQSMANEAEKNEDEIKPKSKPRSRRKPVKAKEVEENIEISSDDLDDMVFEVTDENK